MQVQDLIINNFSKHTETYDSAATIQRQTIELLIKQVSKYKDLLPPGPILEIGCGTGLLSQEITQHLPDRAITISDASESMLSKCQSRVADTHKNLQFEVIDAEKLSLTAAYSAVLSSFALHWFLNLDSAISGIMNALTIDGIFFVALPTAGSFKEWKDICVKANVPFSSNQLPDKLEIENIAKTLGHSSSLQTKAITLNYSSPLEFFKDVRSLGAMTQLTQSPLSTSELLRLINRWSDEYFDKIKITYEVTYGVIQKTR